MVNANAPTIRIDPATLPIVKCPTCHSTGWKQLYALRMMNRFQSPNGQEQLLAGQVGWVCSVCNNPLIINKAELEYPKEPKNGKKPG